MMESKTSESASGSENAEPKVERREPEDPRIGRWKGIRFVENFFVLVCFGCLLLWHGTRPIRDDYTRFPGGLVNPKDGGLPTDPQPRNLSKTIALFSLSTNILLMVLLDNASRCAGEPINKPPMILMLFACEIFSIAITILSLDVYLQAISGVVAGSALCLSVCFATDLAYTSVKGNE
ncbi:UNVERIFIED_CONTAM: hypothetical protein PYX00_003036 [Menopon gallinae]|uniref:Uncharacterized protein n=1 Tax=Menopon gallinae TaxID=328185 RepID=A0AAW2HYK8_9NEOP